MSLFNMAEPGMRFRRYYALLLLSLCLLIAQRVLAQTVEINLGSGLYRIELAVTSAQRRQGLMQRRELAADGGMLLVYAKSGDHRVWMKNMLIPLKVFWIDDEFRVISAQRLEPCSEMPCAVYAAPSASRFILELGDREHGLEVGDRVEGLANL